MNEIKKCSIAGIGFRMERTAFERLNDYLTALNKAYGKNSDREEIIADIEARIAELILSAQSDTNQVVSLPLIENIIHQLGEADDLSDESEPKSVKQPITRRLYRDLEYSKLGGVCAGLGRYFNCDPSLIRLVILIPLALMILFFGISPSVASPVPFSLAAIFGNITVMMVVFYVIMWFAVPAATTVLHKLEMDGEPITAQTIADKKEQTDEQNAKSTLASFVGLSGRVAIVLLKLFVAILILPFIVIAMALIVGIFALVIGMETTDFALGNIGSIPMWSDSGFMWVAVLGILCILIPVLALLYLFIVLLMGKKPRGWVLVISLILWIATIFGTLIAALSGSVDGSAYKISSYTNHDALPMQNSDDIDFDDYQQLVESPEAENIDQ